MNQDEVREVFSAAGAVESFESRENKRGDGLVFVITYASGQDADSAEALNGKEFGGVPCRAAKRIVGREPTTEPGDPTKVFVGRLNNVVSVEELDAAFSPFGTITSIDLANNGRFAIIDFESEADAGKALEMNGKALKDDVELRVVAHTRPIGGVAADKNEAPARAPRARRANPCRIFVAGFPRGFDHTRVQDRFDGVARMIPRGRYSVLIFETPEQAEAAVARNGEVMQFDDTEEFTLRIESSRA